MNDRKEPPLRWAATAVALQTPAQILRMHAARWLLGKSATRGIRSQRVLDAMQSVPRHLFVLPEHVFAAYADEPLPIGEGQTISQPFMVAAMAEALSLEWRRARSRNWRWFGLSGCRAFAVSRER